MSSNRAPLRVLRVGLGLVGVVGMTACDRSASPPESAGSAAPAALASAAPMEPASATASSSAGGTTSAASSAALAPPSTPTATPTDAGSSIALVGPDGSALPQTEEKPSVSSPAFRERIARVARAIQTGDPGPAREAFFPLVAYRQVKAIQDPDRDYERRLLKSFDSDIAEYHRALEKDPSGAVFAGVDVPESRVEWMKPGREGNKVGYYRVLRSKLRFTLASGKEKSFELTSLISWRGEWYVVHLHGFD